MFTNTFSNLKWLFSHRDNERGAKGPFANNSVIFRKNSAGQQGQAGQAAEGFRDEFLGKIGEIEEGH